MISNYLCGNELIVVCIPQVDIVLAISGHHPNSDCNGHSQATILEVKDGYVKLQWLHNKVVDYYRVRTWEDNPPDQYVACGQDHLKEFWGTLNWSALSEYEKRKAFSIADTNARIINTMDNILKTISKYCPSPAERRRRDKIAHNHWLKTGTHLNDEVLLQMYSNGLEL